MAIQIPNPLAVSPHGGISLSQVRDGTWIAAGMVPGAEPVTVTGFATNILTTDVPFLLADAKLPFTFLTTPSALEIVSSSAADTAAGTGARTVLVSGLDANYDRQQATLTMNGLTAVALPGTWLHVNGVGVLTAGSGNTNAGQITVRVAPAGIVQGLVMPTHGVQRALKYTVPRGHILVVDAIYANASTPGGAVRVVAVDSMRRMPNAVVWNTQRNYLAGNTAVSMLNFPSGLVVREQNTFYLNVTAVDANGGNVAVGLSGFLAPLP